MYTFILGLHCTIPFLSQAPFSSSSNHKAIAQLRQLWNGDRSSTIDGSQVLSNSSDGAGDWVGLLNEVDELEDDDDGDYVPDARDDKEAARTISELTPLEM